MVGDNTISVTSQGLSGNYKADEDKGVTTVGTNAFGMKVDGTTISVVNDKLSNNAQFAFDGNDSNGVDLVDGKLSVVLSGRQLKFAEHGTLQGNI